MQDLLTIARKAASAAETAARSGNSDLASRKLAEIKAAHSAAQEGGTCRRSLRMIASCLHEAQRMVRR